MTAPLTPPHWMSRHESSCAVATKKAPTPKRAHVTRCSYSRCEARPRARSPKPCCAARTRLCVFSNATSRGDWMPCRGALPQAESDGSRRPGKPRGSRVIELDPHAVGQDSANWTTERLAEYLGQHTGIQVTEETVRVYLHAHGYVCKRPTWTLRRKAETQAHYVGNARLGRGALSRCHSTRTSTRA